MEIPKIRFGRQLYARVRSLMHSRRPTASGRYAALARRCRVHVTRQRPLPVAGQHRTSNRHQALDPAQKTRNAAITVDEELIRIAAVPETGRTVDAVPPLRRCVKLDSACTQPTSQSGSPWPSRPVRRKPRKAPRISGEQKPHDVLTVRNLPDVLPNARKADPTPMLSRIDTRPQDFQEAG